MIAKALLLNYCQGGKVGFYYELWTEYEGSALCFALGSPALYICRIAHMYFACYMRALRICYTLLA